MHNASYADETGTNSMTLLAALHGTPLRGIEFSGLEWLIVAALAVCALAAAVVSR